jgi:phenylacetate-CoA ligase
MERVFTGLKAVIATSETLLPAQRKELARHFGVPVALEYGCSEVDIISFSCPAGGQHIVADNLIVEVVRFGDEPDGVGQVVVTDLNNTLMPIIRYRVGDLVPLESPSCTCGRGWPCLGQIVGRSQGQYILVPGQGRVHSQFVVYLVEELMARGVVRGRFRIIQEKPDLLRVLFSRQKGSNPPLTELERIFQDECRDTLGPEMTWKVQFVDPSVFETDRVNKYRHFLGMED